MSNIQTIQIEVSPETIQKIFNEHKIVSEYPIDYKKFVKDIIDSTMVITTTVYSHTGDTNYTFTR
jgi:hypothetical protein